MMAPVELVGSMALRSTSCQAQGAGDWRPVRSNASQAAPLWGGRNSSGGANKLLNPSAGVANIHGIVEANGNVMRPKELTVVEAVPPKSFEHPAITINDDNGGAIRFVVGDVAAVGDERPPTIRDGDIEWPAVFRSLPLKEEATTPVEHLHAGVGPICNEDPTCTVQGDAMRQIELAGLASLASPLSHESTIRRKLNDPAVFVAVRHIDRAIGCNRHVGRLVKVRRVIAGDPACSEGEEKLSVVSELIDLVQSDVGEPNVVSLIDGEAVRHGEAIRAPLSEDCARLTVEEDYWRAGDRRRIQGPGRGPLSTRAMEHEHVAVRIHSDPGHDVERVALWEDRPTVDNTIGKGEPPLASGAGDHRCGREGHRPGNDADQQRDDHQRLGVSEKHGLVLLAAA